MNTNAEMNYWRLGTSDSKTSYWDEMKSKKVISIGWPRIGRIDGKNKEEIKKLLRKHHPKNENLISRKAGEIINFRDDIKPNDIVLAQDGDNVLGVGLVIDSKYRYDGSSSFPHQRKIKWISFPTNLRSSRGRNTTVYKLSDALFRDEISKILKNTRGKETAQKANSNILTGEKLYEQRARATLPYLVRQAKAMKPIAYSDLGKEIGITNPRNLNYILGAIGKALITLANKTGEDIPPIQCLVVRKNTGLPGEGIEWFLNRAQINELKGFNKLAKGGKMRVLDIVLSSIYSYPKWDWVLKEFKLDLLRVDISRLTKGIRDFKGKGGEGEYHVAFKNFIANNPSAIGLSSKVGIGEVEYELLSADTVDVKFHDKRTIIGIEVKSRISPINDILRGIFQCIKYKYLIEAEQIINNAKPDCRILLALESKLPDELEKIKNMLGVEVIDNIKIK